jgi:DnaJ-class molecular chaperone
MTKTPGFYDDEGEFHPLPFKWAICPSCGGHGKSSAYLGAFTGEQMRDDPEFAEDYMAGHYDRTCEECGGSGKVKEINERRISAKDLARYDQQERDRQADEREAYNEWLFCGGWREMGWR